MQYACNGPISPTETTRTACARLFEMANYNPDGTPHHVVVNVSKGITTLAEHYTHTIMNTITSASSPKDNSQS